MNTEMDIDGLNEFVKRWHLNQQFTDGIKVIVTIDAGGCTTEVRPHWLLKDFIDKEVFERAGISNANGSFTRLVLALQNNQDDYTDCTEESNFSTITVSKLLSMPDIKTVMMRWHKFGPTSLDNLNVALTYYGFKPIT